jgi:hypothetical protein
MLLKGEGFASFVSPFSGFPGDRGELASSNELRWSLILSRSLGLGENATRPQLLVKPGRVSITTIGHLERATSLDSGVLH